MNESKYFLTYDFKILYCPNTKLKLSCKELDINKLIFNKYNGDFNLIDYYFEIDSNTVDSLSKSVFNGKIGIELIDEDMEWIKKFERLAKTNIHLYENRNLLFNYIIMKLKLAGFQEPLALEFAKSYFLNLDKGLKIPDESEFLKTIEYLINKKTYWIGNNIDKASQLENKFIKTLLAYKRKLQFKFDFSMLKDDYLKIVEKSIVNYLYSFNSTESYCVTKTLTLEEQEPYLIQCYNIVLKNLFKEIIETEYKDFINEDRFINMITKEMINVVRLHLAILKTKS